MDLNHGPLLSGRSGRSSSALGPLTSTRYDVARSDSRWFTHCPERLIGSGPDSSGKRRRRKACGRPQARQTPLLPNDPDSSPLSRVPAGARAQTPARNSSRSWTTTSRSAGDLLRQRDLAQPLNAPIPIDRRSCPTGQAGTSAARVSVAGCRSRPSWMHPRSRRLTYDALGPAARLARTVILT